MADNIKAEIQAQAQKAAEIGKDAILSRAYLYPLQGIYYAATHGSVYGPIKEQVVPRLVLSVVVLVVLFSTVYIPQSLALSLFSGPLGFISAVPLVVSESNFLIQLLSGLFLTDKRDLLFDTVLLDKDLSALVSTGRNLPSGGGGGGKGGKAIGKMTAKLTSPLQKFSPEALVKYLLTIPLNSIPAVGTVLFVTLNGRRAGPNFLARYFQLKQYSDATKKAEIDRRAGSLTAFGVVTVLLGLVPLANQVFELTNVIGAALMAADMERKGEAKSM